MRIYWINILLITVSTVLFAGGCQKQQNTDNALPMTETYHIKQLSKPVTINADYKKEIWQSVKPLKLIHYMGSKPVFMPSVEAKLAYDKENLYVIWLVDDKYVRCVENRYQGNAWEDSCVEFFFTPGKDISTGYFNLETNCGGNFVFRYQKAHDVDIQYIPPKDGLQIEVAHSLPEVISPEIAEPVRWTLEYRIPLKILTNYCKVTPPAPGTVWRVNFYKCADKSTHPHWLTWAKVDYPKPMFHIPESFGYLVFE